MENEKIENLLNLAMGVTEEEREKSMILDVGFLNREKKWEVIVKHTGDLSGIREKFPQVGILELLNSYAIMIIPEDQVEAVASDVQILYMEKPKKMFFAKEDFRVLENVFPSVEGGSARGSIYHGYTGKGVIVAVLDSGIDYAHPDFCNADGTTRILELWDQTLGKVYTSEEINEALTAPDERARYEMIPSRDLSGHGTHVAGIAAGNGRASDGKYTGVAPESSLIVVKLGTQREDSFPRTTELMSAVNYVLYKAFEYRMPVAVNISFGNNYGGHDGAALLETYMDLISDYWKSVIVTGTGNEGASRIHTSGTVQQGKREEIPFTAGAYETGFSLQIWKSFADEFDIILTHPSGNQIGNIVPELGIQRLTMGRTELLIYYGLPSPYHVSQEIFIDFVPTDAYIDPGIWTVTLVPKKIVQGTYHMWLPGQIVLSEGSGFLYPTENTTLTIPSTSAKVISVGAYDARYRKLADFSGRGFTRNNQQVKPDVAAPGVEIVSTAPGGGYAVRSGTSMAAPYVSGLAALMMEEGIVDGKDPYLYGEKLKAFLHRMAKPLEVRADYPNPELGWGIIG